MNMKTEKTTEVIAILIFLIFVDCLAAEPKDELENYEKYLIYYYLDPQPQKAPQVFREFTESKLFTDGKCDDNCQNLMAYFFGRLATINPTVIEKFKILFENSNHKQRILLLKIFKFCADDELKLFLTEKSKDNNYANEAEQIKQLLKDGIPVQFDPLTNPIKQGADLDFLWSEFMVTGNEKAVKRIISVLPWYDDHKDLMQMVIAGAARWSLGSNCKQHKKVLEICQNELYRSTWPTKKYLKEIVAEAGGSVLPPGLTSKKMTKIVSRNTTPGMDPNCWGALPVIQYILGNKYARVEEKPDPPLKLHGLIIANTPDVWMINLWDKTGQHIVDPDPNGGYYSLIIPSDEPNMTFKDFTFGAELDFMKKHNVEKSQLEIEQKQYDLYSIQPGNVKIELIVNKQIPYIVRIFESGKIIHQITYDEYKIDLEPDLSLFEPPEDIEMSETSKGTKN